MLPRLCLASSRVSTSSFPRPTLALTTVSASIYRSSSSNSINRSSGIGRSKRHWPLTSSPSFLHFVSSLQGNKQRQSRYISLLSVLNSHRSFSSRNAVVVSISVPPFLLPSHPPSLPLTSFPSLLLLRTPTPPPASSSILTSSMPPRKKQPRRSLCSQCEVEREGREGR